MKPDECGTLFALVSVMKTKYDLTKERAEKLIAEYCNAIANPNNIPSRVASVSWMIQKMQEHGIIQTRAIAFMEPHALWYAALIVTGNVRKVSRLERKCNLRRACTETTVRRLLKGNSSLFVASLLKEILERV